MKTSVVLLLFMAPMLMQAGWSDFFGIFKKKEPAPEPATTTTPSIILSTTPAVTTTTESNGACWWTQCGTRCTATATVHDFNGANCNPGNYKFRCCSRN